MGTDIKTFQTPRHPQGFSYQFTRGNLQLIFQIFETLYISSMLVILNSIVKYHTKLPVWI